MCWLSIHIFTRLPLPFDAAFLAGKCFYSYRKKGGIKTAPLPDFFIGAHAAIKNMAEEAELKMSLPLSGSGKPVNWRQKTSRMKIIG